MSLNAELRKQCIDQLKQARATRIANWTHPDPKIFLGLMWPKSMQAHSGSKDFRNPDPIPRDLEYALRFANEVTPLPQLAKLREELKAYQTLVFVNLGWFNLAVHQYTQFVEEDTENLKAARVRGVHSKREDTLYMHLEATTHWLRIYEGWQGVYEGRARWCNHMVEQLTILEAFAG
ncbi:hypothetical protein NMY22_g11816 [Coprinellus aureogranulatus]|nr:hypothetical protein NMY22_g11816 [Coprinellus aureogranulatus]